MKVRMGFVSNSSSSSFMIWGCCIDAESFTKEKWVRDLFPEHNWEDEDDPKNKYIGSWEIEQKLLEMPDMENIEVYQPDNFPFYIGISPQCCPDEKPIGQWKKEVSEKLSKIFKEEASCDWYAESWYD